MTTMSDKAATEATFYELITDYREFVAADTRRIQ